MRAIWSIDREGPAQWTVTAGKQFAVISDQIWGFDPTSVYRLQPQTRDLELVAQLPAGNPGIEAILPLPDGSMILAHRDRADRRLLLLDRDGARVWDRSYDSLGAGIPSLLLAGTQPLLLMTSATRAGHGVDLYTVDTSAASLNRFFSGGGTGVGYAGVRLERRRGPRLPRHPGRQHRRGGFAAGRRPVGPVAGRMTPN